MITAELDTTRLQGALSLLNACSEDAQLLQLQNLCVNNGVWTIPEDQDAPHPVVYEVSLFGVFAMADDPKRLPSNWQRAARNILDAHLEEGNTP